jgi:hypothetical protein
MQANRDKYYWLKKLSITIKGWSEIGARIMSILRIAVARLGVFSSYP